MNVPLYKVFTDSEDAARVMAVISRGSWWTGGPEIEQFEKMVADYLGRKYAVAFNSGTSALHAAMLAVGITKADQVVVPSFTFIASANSALFVGANPVFADIEEETFGLSVESVKARITKDTKAIMPVHIGGLVARDAPELREFASEKGIFLIEDACESLGGTLRGWKAGALGNISVLSFCGNKVITTGEGGMAVTDSEGFADKLRLVRSHGRLEKENYFTTSMPLDYVQIGYNWRMPTMVAALGIAQMSKLETVIANRREVAAKLTTGLEAIHGVQTPTELLNQRQTFQMYTIRVREKRDALRDSLAKKGIACKVYFDPVHLSYFYRQMGHHERELPVTEMIAREVLTLPIYPTMTDEEIGYVIQSVKDFFSS